MVRTYDAHLKFIFYSPHLLPQLSAYTSNIYLVSYSPTSLSKNHIQDKLHCKCKCSIKQLNREHRSPKFIFALTLY